MKKDSQIKKIQELEKTIEEWRAKYLRALADYQNLEKRIREVRAEEVKLAGKNIILKLLPIIDILEKAEEVLHDQGLTLALRELHNVLTSESAVKMTVLGQTYDPYRMECIELINGGDENKVVEEIRTGYTIFDKVLRPARVKVAKKHR